MDHPNTQALYGYWNDLRAGRDAPYRSEIDPRRIRGALETMFILETTPEGGVRFRLAGTRLCELAGRELRGMAAESLMIFGHEREMSQLTARALGEPGIGVMRVRAESQSAPTAETWTGELLLLPMRSELGEMSRVLGAVNLADLPRRSRGPGDLKLRCLGARMLPIDVDPDLLTAEDRPRPEAAPMARPARAASIEAGGGFEDAASPFQRGTGPSLVAIDGARNLRSEKPRNRGHLKLVRD